MKRWSRREFVGSAAALAAGASSFTTAAGAHAATHSTSTSFFELIRVPDGVSIYGDALKGPLALMRSGSRWQGSGVEVTTDAGAEALRISVATSSAAPLLALSRVQLRWKLKPHSSLLYLGDAWERSYGDLAWRTIVPERVLPWYFVAHEDRSTAGNEVTHGYGVMTGPAAFCYWQVDPEGVSLWLDVSNGGAGVLLGQRQFAAATVVSRQGQRGEQPAEAVAGLCRKMCPHPRLPKAPVYGTNDWYYAYGENTAAGILRDTDLVVALAPRTGPRPFSVIDGGWQGNGAIEEGQRGNARFPDMAKLAEEIRSRGARPGIWIRPMEAPAGTNAKLLLPSARFHSATASDNEVVYDPTIPEAMQVVVAKMKQVVDWKYELVKHDYSTYDLLGQWGFDMGARPTKPGWSFQDRSRTNAEILLGVYRALRATAGEQTLLLGCNTVGHLAAGVFEINRTGDDTSGRAWERTRRMGVNTLAYRLPQSGAFFMMDADCVGITKQVPWEKNLQWLDLLARSGTAVFISPGPDAVGPEQRAAIARAFAIAAAGQTSGQAVDWFSQTTPENWKFKNGEAKNYMWCGEDGCDASPI